VPCLRSSECIDRIVISNAQYNPSTTIHEKKVANFCDDKPQSHGWWPAVEPLFVARDPRAFLLVANRFPSAIFTRQFRHHPTDSNKLLSSSLPWRQTGGLCSDLAFRNGFDRIIAVIDATTPEGRRY